MTEQSSLVVPDKKLRYKQQRLLLLRHASKCQHESCPVTVHCTKLKALWNHLVSCQKRQCTVRHCMSSRYILTHYRNCRDVTCQTCGPVRHAIGRAKAKRLKLETENNSRTTRVAGVVIPPDKKRKATTTYQDVFQGDQDDAFEPLPFDDDHGSNSTDSSCPIVTPTVKKARITWSDDGNNDDKPVMSPALRSMCMEILRSLKTHDHGWVFNHPVDPVFLQIPDYFEIIKTPMDLGTVEKKLSSYETLEQFQSDVNLTFDNALTYNQKGSAVYEMAREIKGVFHQELVKRSLV